MNWEAFWWFLLGFALEDIIKGAFKTAESGYWIYLDWRASRRINRA